ncbi:MAG: class I SAM-dependent methyltransferase [Casimicrobiaceae bacterium]
MNATTPPPRRRDFEAGWRERFREFAEDRDDDAGIAGWTVSGLDARIRRFRDLWRPGAANDAWLDAGCGAGTYSRMLAEHGARVIGVDYSPLALAKARERSVADIDYVVADVRRLPFRPRTFDGVVCFGVTQALSDGAPAIAELSALVRPGGLLWIDALNRWCVVHLAAAGRRKLRGRPVHLRYDSPSTILRLLARAGMTEIELHWMPILPRRLQRWQGWCETSFARSVLRHVPLVGLFGCHAFLVRCRRPAASP